MKTYHCNNCEETFKFKQEVTFCPYCGSNEIVEESHLVARKTAKRLIEKLYELQPKIEKKRDEYYMEYVKAYDIRQFLAQMKKRGVISEEEIPVFDWRKSVSEYLKEYRSERRKEA